MASDDIKRRAAKLEKLMLASSQSKHIAGVAKPLPTDKIKERARQLEKLLGTTSNRPSTAPKEKLGKQPFTLVSPEVWTEIWTQTENCLTTAAAQEFVEWTRLWVLEPVAFRGGTVAMPTGCVTGPAPNRDIQHRIADRLKRPEALRFCEDAMPPIARWFENMRVLLTVPTQAWYPMFAVYSGPVAPPTPNVPGRFSAMTQLAEVWLKPSLLSAEIESAAISSSDVRQWVGHFGSHQKNIGRAVSTLVAERLTHVVRSVFDLAMVEGVLAMGTVPDFSPQRPIGAVHAHTLPAVGFLRGVEKAVELSLKVTEQTMTLAGTLSRLPDPSR